MKLAVTVGLVLLVSVSGCDRNKKQDERGLLEKISNRTGPDELAVVPQDPLVAPANFNSLPPPNPGGSNLADLTPGFDTVVALTGSAPRGNVSAAGDAALVAAVVARAGTAPEDGFNFLGLFGGNSDLLDAQAELLRLRALGVRTPAAPSQ